MRRLGAAVLLAVLVSVPVTACTRTDTPASPSAAARDHLSFRVMPSASSSPDEAAMARIRAIVEHRLAAAGFADPVVATVGLDRTVVDVPLGTDRAAIQGLVERRGELTFVPLPIAAYGTTETMPEGPSGIVDGKALPNDPQLVPLFTGAQVTSADLGTDQQTGRPIVSITLDREATKLFADYSGAHVGEFFAIVLDGTVISAPAINGPITGGSGQIAMGNDANDVTHANELVNVLRYGSLPYQLQLEQPAEPSASP